MISSQQELLTGLLKQVSRSFYLTLAVLPRAVRRQIGVAYLLARTTDTIADTGLVSVEKRLSALDELRARILGRGQAALDFGELSERQGSAAERVLLERCSVALEILEDLSAADVGLVRAVLETITSGQELDLRRFAGASKGNVIALKSEEELDDYTYRVAGCVGEFWTRICRAHLFPNVALDEQRLLDDGVLFGKGLQLVNILRDLAGDVLLGRCYLPGDRLAELGLLPEDLLKPEADVKFRPLYDRYLGWAEDHLKHGWRYAISLPRGQVRVRLACAWPVLIGVETLKLLRSRPVLDPRQRIKVSRGRIRSIMARTVLYYPWERAWSGLAPGPRSAGQANAVA